MATSSLNNLPVSPFMPVKEEAIPTFSPSLAAFSGSVALTPFTDGVMFHTLIQHLHSTEDTLALTQVNRQGYALRFYSPHLQRFYFKTAEQVVQFIGYCQETTRTDQPRNSHRKPEDFSPVHSLSLALSERLTIEQCVPIFQYMPGICQLEIQLEANGNVSFLGPLLKAAQQCKLTHLCIEQSITTDTPEREDGLPIELWAFSHLKSLNLHNLVNVREVGEEIGQLSALTHLELNGLEEITRLPTAVWSLSALERLVLKDLPLLEEMADEIGDLAYLTSLTVVRTGIDTVPENICHLTRLQELKLGNVLLPEGMNQLTSLTSLTLSAICDLLPLAHSTLQSPFEHAPAAFPLRLWQLSNLQRLVLSRQENIVEIGREISHLQSLTSLSLSEMPLQALPEGLWELPKLTQLTLNTLPELKAIPANITTLSALTTFELVWLDKISQLPQELGKMKKLEKLMIIGLEALSALPESLSTLPVLRFFTLATTATETLPDLSVLEVLNLGNVKKLSSLPETLKNVSTLKKIKLYEVPNIVIPAALVPIVEVTTDPSHFLSD